MLDHYIHGISVDEQKGVIIATDVNKDEPIIEYRYHSAAKEKTHLVRIKNKPVLSYDDSVM